MAGMLYGADHYFFGTLFLLTGGMMLYMGFSTKEEWKKDLSDIKAWFKSKVSRKKGVKLDAGQDGID